MRIIVFFDLPVTTVAKRKAANQFRHFLLKDGYQMLQLSVYSRIVALRNEKGSYSILMVQHPTMIIVALRNEKGSYSK